MISGSRYSTNFIDSFSDFCHQKIETIFNMTDDLEKIFKVLIADDDTDIRSIIVSIIKELGVITLVAADGTEACNIYEKELPDLVVLDYMMPGMTGFELCKWIKERPEGALVPVVILTARTEVKDIIETLEAGADEYLTKPFHYRELQARISSLLRIRELNLSLTAKNAELKKAQDKLIESEKQLTAVQLGASAAHRLGQPLSAIILNCHLIETLEKNDPIFMKALSAIKSDCTRMASMLDDLRAADSTKTVSYFNQTSIIDIGKT